MPCQISSTGASNTTTTATTTTNTAATPGAVSSERTSSSAMSRLGRRASATGANIAVPVAALLGGGSHAVANGAGLRSPPAGVAAVPGSAFVGCGEATAAKSGGAVVRRQTTQRKQVRATAPPTQSAAIAPKITSINASKYPSQPATTSRHNA